MAFPAGTSFSFAEARVSLEIHIADRAFVVVAVLMGTLSTFFLFAQLEGQATILTEVFFSFQLCLVPQTPSPGARRSQDEQAQRSDAPAKSEAQPMST